MTTTRSATGIWLIGNPKSDLKGGEATSWDYGQKLKKHLKHFAKFQLSTIYGF